MKYLVFVMLIDEVIHSIVVMVSVGLFLELEEFYMANKEKC